MRTRRVCPDPIPRSAFAGFCFPPDVIVLAVRWYLRFGLSYRDAEELLAERGIEVDHVTVYRWVQRFTPLLAEAARPCRHRVGDRWQVDETYVKVAGRWRYIYRAIDQSGQVIDVFVSPRRDGTAARRFFERAISTTKTMPNEVVTDLASTYPVVVEELLPTACHRTDRHANNRIEADHGRLKARLRPMRGLRQENSARVVIAGHAIVQKVRRGHYELAAEEPVKRRLAVAFDELALRSEAPPTVTLQHARTDQTQHGLWPNPLHRAPRPRPACPADRSAAFMAITDSATTADGAWVSPFVRPALELVARSRLLGKDGIVANEHVVGYDGMWAKPEDDPRAGGSPVGELGTIREYLSNYRLTLGMKCEDLSPEQLATRSVPPSTLSLLGLIRHMARVEHNWFQRSLQGHRDMPRLFWSPDDGDLDFNGAIADPAVVEEAFAAWKAQIAAADEWLDGQIDLDAVVLTPRGEQVGIRDILIHMIEEYARHCGHADLLRERIDGRTGQ